MLTLYAAPAGVDDAARSNDPQALREAWHSKVSGFVKNAKKRAPFFYDHLLDELEIADSKPRAIPWAAFPKWINTVFEGFDGPFDQQKADRFAETTSPVGLYVQQANGTFSLTDFRARQQDEYCEWAIKREGDRIVSLQFTAEPPEYWESLSENDEKLTTTLYQELLKNSSIQTDDLRFDKNYYGADSNGRP